MHHNTVVHTRIACIDMTRRDTPGHTRRRRGAQPPVVYPGAAVRFAWCGRACRGVVLRDLGTGRATGLRRFLVRSRDLPGRDLVLLYEHEIAEAA